MAKKFDRKLIFEDGSEYYGYGFGANETRVLEAVFNTSPVGYQEIVSDPSYTYQLVTMAYPVIGNYGVCDEDYETKIPTLGALAVRDYNDVPSNFRCTKTLSGMMEEYGIPGISGIDTRKLVRSLRDHGSRRCLLCGTGISAAEGAELIRRTPVPKDAVKLVSSRGKWYSKTAHPKFNVVAVDCGIKLNIVRSLNRRGCNVTVVPYNATAEEVLSLCPDGVFLSNGPGDPEDVKETISLVKDLLGKVPLFGICLGHQLISLAYGAKTYKLKFGHRGGNHPVKNLKTGKIEITSQNHSFAVDENSLKNTPLTLTHLNLLDQTVEGVECEKDKVFSVQYHPESAPGPQDSGYLFDRFIALMEENRNA